MKRRNAFTMIETIISLLIVGVVLVAVLQTVAAARTAQKISADRSAGLALAEALMSEILQKPYDDPQGNSVLGLESNESVTGHRLLFDDVDDFNGWTDEPPRNPDGSTIPNTGGYSRAVSVHYVLPDALQTTSVSDTGVKRIRVSVEQGKRTVAELTSYRSRLWDNQVQR